VLICSLTHACHERANAATMAVILIETDGFSAARIEEEVVVTDKGGRVISLFPAEALPIANRYWSAPLRCCLAGIAATALSSSAASSGDGSEWASLARSMPRLARTRQPRLSIYPA
jgi:hypothetical protein